ncbi:hypothetical protein ACQ4PT_063584 [Festuca glaucescens]
MSDVTAVMELGVEEPRLELPPGFRFHPTDEEVITSYLTPKVLDEFFSCLVMADVDLNKCEPWDLPSKAKMGEKEWFFFVHKDRKYPTGMRTNRATESGYWKATGKDKEILRGKGRAAVLVGMKKTLVFYLGRAPHGTKTPWVMHEYRLDGRLPAHLPLSAKDEWAVCRVFNKDLAAKNAPQPAHAAAGSLERTDSFAFLDDFLASADLPALVDSPYGAVEDDFAGASSSTSGAVAPAEPNTGFYDQVKTEQPAPPQPQPQQTQGPYYFSMPAAPTGIPSGVCAGYSQYQAAGNQQDAIRRHCRPQAPSSSAMLGPLLGAEAEMPSLMPPSRQPSFLDLDDLSSDPLMDYTNMWKY